MKVLVIEDSAKTVSFLRKGLTQHGFVVDAASDGASAFEIALGGHYDAFVIDVMLPERDGFSLLADLRSRGVATPAVFLTARGELDDRMKGFAAGADDYLVKPFAISELVARLRAILRRGNQLAPERMRVADLEIEPARFRAVRAGVVLALTPKEFSLLSLMVRHCGEVLTRTMIAERVWNMRHDSGTNLVDVHIGRLRAKVDGPFETRLIHTVRGVGYVLEERA